ncbi:MAG: Hsp20 family protein [Candidatus Izemoplasmataceae bacterium]
MFKLTPLSNSLRRRDDDFVDFYNMIDDFFSTPLRTLRTENFKLDVKEDEHEYQIFADLPGIKKEDLKISYDDQVLMISVERNEEKEEKEENYIHRERQVCSMKRALNLPNVDKGQIKARLEDGVLNITAKKTQVQDQSYVIEVE